MVRVRAKFLVFYSELAPLTRDVTCSVTLLRQKVYEEAMSDEHPHNAVHINCILLDVFLYLLYFVEFLRFASILALLVNLILKYIFNCINLDKLNLKSAIPTVISSN